MPTAIVPIFILIEEVLLTAEHPHRFTRSQ